jgi:glycosyltransferase involved in cell wall biosynthesis
LNVHIHPVSLDHASRILKCLESSARSRCFHARAFIGAGSERHYEFQDAFGSVQVQLFPRLSGRHSNFLRKALATSIWARNVKAHAKKLPAKCINVHGLSTLALGVALKRHHHCKLIYDTHELETKTLAVRGVRRVYSERLERALIPHCDSVVCVSDGIADWYATQYGITRPLVVRNVPDRRSQVVAQSAKSLRAGCGVPPGALLFLYQGGLATGRQIERFIDVFARLASDRHLVFMGRGELEGAVRTASANHANIHYHPAVPPGEVLGYTAQADVGLVGMENTCLNHWLSLPNKLFECLAAGVPVIAPDFPEIRRVMDGYHCGWNWPGDAEGLAALVGRLSPEEIKVTRERALRAGRELSWEKEEQKLLSLYQGLLS